MYVKCKKQFNLLELEVDFLCNSSVETKYRLIMTNDELKYFKQHQKVIFCVS